jgi:hypothetical protein
MLDHAGSRYSISDGQLQARAARHGASTENCIMKNVHPNRYPVRSVLSATFVHVNSYLDSHSKCGFASTCQN